MAIPSNSILNQDWYNRLLQNIREQVNTGIRGTGSEANDPFWAAKRKQAEGDLNNQRQDALRAMIEQGNAMRGQGVAREKAYQERVTWGLKNMNPQGTNPATYLGVQAENPPLPGEVGSADGTGLFSAPTAAPEAYRAPMSGSVRLPISGGAMSGQQLAPAGGASFGLPKPSPAYNPAQFDHAAFDYTAEEKRMKDLQRWAAETAYSSAQEDLAQKKLKKWRGFDSPALTYPVKQGF